MSITCGHDHHHEPDASVPGPERIAAYRRVLWAVLVINAVMFVVEIASGVFAKSVSLQADALDFLGDSFAYAITLFVVGMQLRYRAAVALLKGLFMGGFGLWLIGLSAYHAFFSTVPLALVMGGVGFAALVANLASTALLFGHRSGDANMRSIWLCTRNDAIANVAIMIAALAVGTTGTGWPDYVVALVMASLAISASAKVLRLSFAEMAGLRTAAGTDGDS